MFASLLAARHSGPLRQLLSFNMPMWEAHCAVFDRVIFLNQRPLHDLFRRTGVTVNLFLYPWFQVGSDTLCACCACLARPCYALRLLCAYYACCVPASLAVCLLRLLCACCLITMC